MRMMLRTATVIMAVGILSASTLLATISRNFQSFTTQTIPTQPCAAHGGLLGPASLGQDVGSMVLAFTCRDEQVVLLHDVQASSTITGATSVSTIHLYLDAPFGQLFVGVPYYQAAGWAYECGHQIASASLMLGSVEVWSGQPERWQRPDVAAANSNVCPTEMTNSGVGFLFDTVDWPTGAFGLQLIVKDETGAIGKSNVLPITVHANVPQ